MAQRTPTVPRAAPFSASGDPEAKASLTVAELCVGGIVLTLGVVSWVSLDLAHLGRYRLWLAALIAVALLGVGWLLARRAPRPPIVRDRGELVMVTVVGIVAALLFFPGFPYGTGDKDPGVYVEHGIAIQRTHSFAIDDPILKVVPNVAQFSPGARFPGIWIAPGKRSTIVPQFYHLYPAALAGAYTLLRYGGVAGLNPLFGVLAVLAFALALRRAFGSVAGAIGGLVLATNMIEVWGAKFTTTEVMTQAFFLTATLGVIVALQTRWKPAAAGAGVLTGLTWLARADGLLIVLIAVAVGCSLIAMGRFDGRARWFAVGLASTMPSALGQAYHYARPYTAAEKLPSLQKLVALVVVLVVLALVIRGLMRPLGLFVARLLQARGIQLLSGIGIIALAAIALALGFLRRRLFGFDYTVYNGQRVIRTYNEFNLRRLSWFVTLPGFALMWFGLCVALVRRWSAAVWTVLLPFLLLFPLYAFDARNSPRLMWWSRRYVPFTLPGVIALIALALAFAWNRRWPFRTISRVVAGGLAIFIVAVGLTQSLPIRGHREFGGSFAIARRIAHDSASRQGIFIWPRSACCSTAVWLFGSPLWFQQDQMSAILPATPTPGYVRQFVDGFPDRAVYLVFDGEQRPAWMPEGSLELVDHVVTTLPMWKEADLQRPDGPRRIGVNFSVWRVVPV